MTQLESGMLRALFARARLCSEAFANRSVAFANASERLKPTVMLVAPCVRDFRGMALPEIRVRIGAVTKTRDTPPPRWSAPDPRSDPQRTKRMPQRLLTMAPIRIT